MISITMSDDLRGTLHDGHPTYRATAQSAVECEQSHHGVLRVPQRFQQRLEGGVADENRVRNLDGVMP